MTKLKLGVAAGAAAVLAFGLAACGQTTPASEETTVEESVDEAADAMGEAAGEAADAMGEAAESAGEAVEGAVEDAGTEPPAE